MLFNTYKKFNYTGDVYGYRIVTSADGTVTSKEYDVAPRQFKMQISTSFIGDLIILLNQKVQNESYIKVIKDRNGDEIYPNGVWKITQTQPITNALGIVEGYKYKAKIISGDI